MSRNTAIGLAQRTRKNLQHIRHAHATEEDVHPITQLLTSLLGFIVLPWERHETSDLVKATLDSQLCELYKQGWPRWNITCDCPTKGKKKTKTLKQLVHHIRNAASHGRIAFDSESRNLEEVTFLMEDAPGKNGAVNWRAEIRGDHLYTFCIRFTTALVLSQP